MTMHMHDGHPRRKVQEHLLLLLAWQVQRLCWAYLTTPLRRLSSQLGLLLLAEEQVKALSCQ